MLFEVEELFDAGVGVLGVLELVANTTSVVFDTCKGLCRPDSIGVAPPVETTATSVPVVTLGAVSLVGGDGGPFLLVLEGLCLSPTMPI